MLKPESFYADAGIDLILSTRAAAILRDEKYVVLADGRRLAYETLILATGARARLLPIPAPIFAE